MEKIIQTWALFYNEAVEFDDQARPDANWSYESS
jgi:hypothetical protein